MRAVGRAIVSGAGRADRLRRSRCQGKALGSDYWGINQ